MKRLAILLLLAFPAAHATERNFGTVQVSQVTSIYDGDTLTVNIAGWPPIVGERIGVRVLDVDAPEMKGKCQAETLAARKAKQFAVAMLRNAKVIELRDIHRDKYFRLLAHVYVDGRSLGAALLAAGLVRAYDGGHRGGWCD